MFFGLIRSKHDTRSISQGDKNLQDEVLTMGDMVAIAIKESVEALRLRDTKASEKVIKNDAHINKKTV